ncbi:MAG: hypothetical protein SF029_21595 [bacterium]|nr:hypothetical protein [bacterium]
MTHARLSLFALLFVFAGGFIFIAAFNTPIIAQSLDQNTTMDTLVPLEPEGTISVPGGDVEFIWEDIDTAILYEFVILNSAGAVLSNHLLDRPYYCFQTCSFTPGAVWFNERLGNGNYVWGVRAFLEGEGWTAWNGLNFTQNVPLPALVTMGEATNTNTLRPMVTWRIPENSVATAFRLYIAPSSNLGTPAYFDWVVRDTACAWSGTDDICRVTLPLDLQDNTEYQAFVQSWNMGGALTTGGAYNNGYAGPLTFTVDVPPPAVPNLSVAVSQGLPTLTWATDSRATRYTLYITDGDGRGVHFKNYPNTPAMCRVTTSTCILVPDYVFANGRYNFYLNAVGAGGPSLGGAYNNGYAGVTNVEVSLTPPDAPEQIAPNAATVDRSADLSFTWDTVAGAAWYNLWVGTVTPTFTTWHYQWYRADALGCAQAGSECSAQPGLILPNGAFAWNVQAASPGGIGPWADGLPFTVAATLPGVVTIVEPAGTTTDNTPQIVWNDIPTAEWYQVWLGTNTGTPLYVNWHYATRGDDALCNSGVCRLTAPGVVLSNGGYIVNVQAASPAGIGPWNNAPYFTFSVNVPAPAMPVLQTPYDQTWVYYNEPVMFGWQAVPFAEQYRLDVYNTALEIVYSGWHPAASICPADMCWLTVPLTGLPGFYSWKVVAANAVGSSTSVIWFFEYGVWRLPTRTPPPPTGDAPVWTPTSMPSATPAPTLLPSLTPAPTLTPIPTVEPSPTLTPTP